MLKSVSCVSPSTSKVLCIFRVVLEKKTEWLPQNFSQDETEAVQINSFSFSHLVNIDTNFFVRNMRQTRPANCEGEERGGLSLSAQAGLLHKQWVIKSFRDKPLNACCSTAATHCEGFRHRFGRDWIPTYGGTANRHVGEKQSWTPASLFPVASLWP